MVSCNIWMQMVHQQGLSFAMNLDGLKSPTRLGAGF